MTARRPLSAIRGQPEQSSDASGDSRIAHSSNATGNEAFDALALYRLMAWLSPAYPVGAFSYSGGIEWAVESGDIKDAETLKRWLAVMMTEGGVFCDAVFFVHAHRAVTSDDGKALRD